MFAAAASVQAFAAPGAFPALRAGRTQNVAVRVNRFASSLAMALPSGWEKVKDTASGDFYYYNKQTGVTQWEAPAAQTPAVATATKSATNTKFDVKEFERTGRIVPLEDGGADEPLFVNPLIKVASAGMGLIKPIFAAEATLQAAALGGIAKVSTDDVVTEIEANKKANPCLIYTYKLSPFSTEALSLLEKSGYEYTNIELGLEWFALGGRGSQTRVALAGMCENGATSLPKIFIGGKSIGGASGFSALADVVEAGELDALMAAAGAAKK